MQDQKKVYGKFCVQTLLTRTLNDNIFLGFTISLYEYEATIPTLWDTVKGLHPILTIYAVGYSYNMTEFMAENPDLVTEGNAMGFVSDNSGQSYNRCHCTCPLSQTARTRSE